MAMFVQVESERRRKQQEATGYSPAAKLRDFRKDMSGGLADGGSTTSDANASAAGCHAAKTAIDSQSMVEDDMPLLSRFSLETHAAFVMDQRPPQLVADLHEPR